MAQKKYASYATVQSIINNIKNLFVKKTDLETSLSNKADKSHTHSISDTTNLQSTLDGKVPTSRTINNKPLTANITLSASDVGAAPSSVQTSLNTVSDTLDEHTSNSDIHFTAAERTKLSNIQSGAQVNTITGVKGNSESSYRTGNVNITKANIGLGNVDNTSDANKPISTAQQLAFDEVNNAIDTHTENDDIHVTTTDKTNWNAAHTHSTSAHARTDATKVEDSSTNGNIKINGTETNVYSHPTSGVTAGTYKSVTVNAQGHVTGGSNPTTLSGFGITDGALKSDVTNHNTSTSAHNDIRLSITELTTKLNNFLDVDDTTTDQLSELLTLIEDNATDIESITNGKVNVSDIINNLTTNVTNKPLSAAQGVAIKTLIDALQDELDTHKHSASDITSGTLSSDRLPVVPITKGGTGANNAATARANIGAVSKTGDTMSGNLNIQLDTDTAPQITMKAEANSSGKRGTANIRKYAFANSDYGTEIEDKTFDGSFMRLNLKASATSPAELITFKNRVYSGSSYSDKEYKLYGEHNKPTLSDIGLTATATELNYVDGVTSNIQAQIDSKLDADAITGGASTIISDNLTTNRVLVSDNYGKVGASSITGGELNYLDGATRNIQAQLDDLADAVSDKVNVFGDTMTGNLIIEPNNTYSPRIQLIGNENASGQQAEASFMKGANSSVDNGTSIVDTTFDGRETTLTIQSNKQFDEQKLSLRIADANGNYEDYYIYGEHHMPTATELGVLENSDTDLHDFITERNAMYASNIVGDDVMPFIDVSLKSGRKITVNELLKYLKNNSGMASVATVTTAEYTALEQAEATNANTLYMITDAEEEVIPQIQFITWEEND